jgi:hypothetical protein
MKSIKLLTTASPSWSKKASSSSTSSNSSSSSSYSSSDLLLGSDVLIPLVVLMVVRSNIQNIYSSLHYIQQFSFEHDVVSGEHGYAVSTLEAVIEYITSNAESLSQTCKLNRAIQLAVMEGKQDEVERYLTSEGEVQGTEKRDDDTSSPMQLLDVRNWDGDSLLHLAVMSNLLGMVKYCK